MSVLLRQPHGFEGFFRVAKWPKADYPSFAEGQDVSGARFSFDPAALAAIVDSPHEQDDVTDAEFVVNIEANDFPRIVHVLDVFPHPRVASVTTAHRESRAPVDIRIGQGNKARQVASLDRVDDFVGQPNVLLRHRPPSIPQAQESA